MQIDTEAKLDEILSRPSDADAAAIAQLAGELLILGAGGKMGPSLARRARRAADKAGVRKRIVAVVRFLDNSVPGSLVSDRIETLVGELLAPDRLYKIHDGLTVSFLVAR